ASFTEDAHTAPVGTTINFDPISSSDPDGTIVLYEWDFDGDGVYDLSTATPSTVSYTYTIPGTYIVTLRVTDNDGLTDIATATKTITLGVSADLSISSPDISFSDSNPREGQSILVSATVHNLGEGNAENITLQFFDALLLIGERQISSISHHSHGITSIDWPAENEGFHLIKVVVDPHNTIIETEEENNEATRSILVGEILGFGGISVNGSAAPNETHTGCLVTVQGYAEYNTTYGAGEPVAGAEVTITILGWRQESTHTICDGTYIANISAPYSPGNYTLVVTVTDYTFWESIEMSLVVTQQVGVDLTMSHHDISFSPSNPKESENAAITVTIHNVGTENVSNVLVAFYDNGKPVENGTIDLVPGRGNRDTTVLWIATPSGWHTIKVVV
ncbi:MAG: PKD domain-containing protein, partial [Thermoplasmata archaeon]|nr:PKD domain-containing protein [Thermoplasmata archaeon]